MRRGAKTEVTSGQPILEAAARNQGMISGLVNLFELDGIGLELSVIREIKRAEAKGLDLTVPLFEDPAMRPSGSRSRRVSSRRPTRKGMGTRMPLAMVAMNRLGTGIQLTRRVRLASAGS